MNWTGRPAASVVQALRWLAPAANDPQTVMTLQRRLPNDVKHDLAKGTNTLPDWATRIVSKVVDGQGAVA